MDYRITVIVPSEPAYKTFQKTMQEMNCNYPIYLASTNAAVKIAQEILPQGLRLIISCGRTGKNLSQCLPVPVLDIPFSGLDTIATVQKILTYPGKAIHIGTIERYYHIQRSLEILHEPLDRIAFHYFDLERPLEDQVQELIGAGYEVFSSSHIVVEYAEKHGKIGFEYDVDRLNAENTLILAQDTLKSFIQQERRNEFDNAILQASADGIIALDDDRNISNINPAAFRLFQKAPSDLIGKSLASAMEESNLIDSKIYRTCFDLNPKLTPVFLHELPIIVDKQQMGSVISIKKVSDIHELDYQVRKDLIVRGLVAKSHFSDIVGKSASICQAKERAEIYAKYDSTILICGETGTGKELFAQSIHNASNRRNEPFVAINCATLPESLIESELFGYVKGAFTGANREGKQGLFELANKGTIFLDEISEIPIAIQSKLLRAIQEGELIRVGGDKVIRVDVRVICSSNKDLLQLVQEGKFKDDLYYRLSVLEINIPPLRDRIEDVEYLSYALLQEYARKHSKNISSITPEVLTSLSKMQFLGNVRELGNIIERMVILANGSSLDMEALQKCDLRSAPTPSAVLPPVDPTPVPPPTLNIRDAQVEMILSALEKCGGNKAAAARLLGINTSTLWRKMKAYQLM